MSDMQQTTQCLIPKDHNLRVARKTSDKMGLHILLHKLCYIEVRSDFQ